MFQKETLGLTSSHQLTSKVNFVYISDPCLGVSSKVGQIIKWHSVTSKLFFDTESCQVLGFFSQIAGVTRNHRMLSLESQSAVQLICEQLVSWNVRASKKLVKQIKIWHWFVKWNWINLLCASPGCQSIVNEDRRPGHMAGAWTSC